MPSWKSSKSTSKKATDPLIRFHQISSQLRKNWQPHEDQTTVWNAIFDGYRSIFIQCGRKWGKTEIALDILWLTAKWFPGVPCYYIAPFQKQAKEIVWADPRLQNFGPRDWLLPGSSGINNTELRLNFTNGSFIKVDGSDNYEAYRGPRFKVCVYDEYKEHRPEFRRAMRPNAAVLDGIEVFMGSPPNRECDYTVLAKEHKESPKKFWHRAPTLKNPHIPKDWLEEERQSLIAKGEEDEWQREYMAEFVPGGITKIFPMVDQQMVHDHQDLMSLLRKDLRKLHYYVVADPAAASVFAVLFAALNPYTKTWYLLDEIYETDQAEMSVGRIGMRINSMKMELNDRADWTQVYDEAETWFKNEMFDRFSEFWQPTQKAQNKKEAGLSLLKDVMLHKKVVISSRCKKLFWEMDNYFKDKNGRIPKTDDHLIDCFRYTVDASYYTLKPKQEYVEHKDEDYRGSRISDDFPDLDDWGDAQDSAFQELEFE